MKQLNIYKPKKKKQKKPYCNTKQLKMDYQLTYNTKTVEFLENT